jgi:cytochrome c oxidase subunit 3/cytochrome o ubiquinol oxidase subunit 3
VSTEAAADPVNVTDWTQPSPRKVGMILVILTESALFTIFVVAYVYYIGKSLNPPYPHEVLTLPILGTVMLLSSSGTIVRAEHWLKHNNLTGFHLWWGITILLGLGFLVYTGVEWNKLIYKEHLTLSSNLFGSTYYSLVGLHASHVVVGAILLSLVLIASLRGSVRHHHHEHIEMVSWYWHFVDVVWVVVFTVVYVISART